jgi:hypothetical protein
MDQGELGRFLFTAERFDRSHAALAVTVGNSTGYGSARPAPPTSRISDWSGAIEPFVSSARATSQR